MGVIKWIGYLILSAIVLCVAGGFLAFILSASAVIAVVALIGFGVMFIAFCINEYFKSSDELGPRDRDW